CLKQASKKFGGDEKQPKLRLMADENSGGFPNGKNNGMTDTRCESKRQMKSPSLVARLMGLESMPAGSGSKPQKASASETWSNVADKLGARPGGSDKKDVDFEMGSLTYTKLPSSLTKEVLIADIIDEVEEWTQFVGLIPDELIEWDMSHSLERESSKETGCRAQEDPVLCINDCDFFGSAATMNMCSKCQKDMILLIQEHANLVAASRKDVVRRSSSSDESELALAGAAVASADFTSGVKRGFEKVHNLS
ncbi:Zinc finger A20 and AN1 domain-containing stress-associated protein 8, partial [Capsicum chinense]